MMAFGKQKYYMSYNKVILNYLIRAMMFYVLNFDNQKNSDNYSRYCTNYL
jgi:hypothetical protein